ncbi:chromosome replication/partitioning protein (plasmid) [Borrelia miyamotoi]|uniref:Chromosome replication/partitioning protein n=1 Tax=Borrelia miyamotoi TaxID=47466 RepID=A0AAX3JPZ2_9SPIR|nr:chromosome replication/partitioning protein [Borrelia miyamotoi]ATQ19062.1 chromosome replication/partitioning protein [Borrelia miyamotoi]ATQ20245.1 chromosome replication/partitioning protein [Borrelia miyamotoi]QBK63913.1 chromosome replication/partitioning protein [Borrelia miyamotoi]QBL99348.1 chromosome replication/partitioning protein [Borrelia miyamotoi]WAZ72703.1 chromosome replication/partitioning protein [Borrelia miyamotoi]
MDMGIKINDRVLSRIDSKKYIEQDIALRSNEEIVNHYSLLKEQLKSNIQNEIYNKIETMKILKEIKDNNYYKLDGYKSFDAFIKDYKLAKTQTYEYLKIANAIEEGVIEEVFLLENGIKETIFLLRNKSSNKLKKSKQNLIKPLRFQLKRHDSYDFYKKNSKFTAFILDKIFSSKKDLLEELMNEFKSLKS